MVDHQPFLSVPEETIAVTTTSYYDGAYSDGAPANQRRPVKEVLIVFSGLLMVALLVVIIGSQQPDFNAELPNEPVAMSRGKSAGVSEKTNHRLFSGVNVQDFPWDNSMLSWQRTAYHFQPQNNWMNGTLPFITFSFASFSLLFFCFLYFSCYVRPNKIWRLAERHGFRELNYLIYIASFFGSAKMVELLLTFENEFNYNTHLCYSILFFILICQRWPIKFETSRPSIFVGPLLFDSGIGCTFVVGSEVGSYCTVIFFKKNPNCHV